MKTQKKKKFVALCFIVKLKHTHTHTHTHNQIQFWFHNLNLQLHFRMPEDNVKVAVRCRPFNGREKNMGCKQIITVNEDANQICITKV